MAETEMRPRRDVGTSRDRLETETSRPRPQPCKTDTFRYCDTEIKQLRFCYQLQQNRTAVNVVIAVTVETCEFV